jgi:hypothetical protein
MPAARPRWHALRAVLAPRWLAWHAFAAVAAAGMLWLGDWQLRRAQAGNELSWAYTVEWPLFTVLGILFWIRTIREALRPPPGPVPEERPEPAEHAARLAAEVRRHGRWHGLR